jgi:hypothetical protein
MKRIAPIPTFIFATMLLLVSQQSAALGSSAKPIGPPTTGLASQNTQTLNPGEATMTFVARYRQVTFEQLVAYALSGEKALVIFDGRVLFHIERSVESIITVGQGGAVVRTDLLPEKLDESKLVTVYGTTNGMINITVDGQLNRLPYVYHAIVRQSDRSDATATIRLTSTRRAITFTPRPVTRAARTPRPTAQRQVVPTRTLRPTNPPAPTSPPPDAGCPGLSYTCSQLTCAQAYACLRAGNGRLDSDHDGIPCESKCGG